MNLAKLYSLTLGQKITKPYLNPVFYPLPFDNYIVIQGFTKQSKNYDYWVEIIELIKPELDKNNIQLVSVGVKGEENLPHCYHTAGNTSFQQLEYIIQNSLGYIGADSISAHIAGGFNKPLIVLTSNNYAENVCPFFGDKSIQVVLEPPREDGEKPSFSLQESPKSINRIKPEIVIDAINRLLNLSVKNVKSVHFGEGYSQFVHEYVPNFPLNPQTAPNSIIHIRLDFLNELTQQNYQNTLQIAAQRKVILYTEKPFNLDIFKQVKGNISLIVYKLPTNEDNESDLKDIDFVKRIKKAGFPFTLIKEYKNDELSKENIADLKFQYLDVAPIQFVEKKKVEINYSPDLYYRSNRVIFSNNVTYFSKAAFEKNLNAPTNTARIDSEEFFKSLLDEQQYLYIYEKR